MRLDSKHASALTALKEAHAQEVAAALELEAASAQEVERLRAQLDTKATEAGGGQKAADQEARLQIFKNQLLTVKDTLGAVKEKHAAE
eukprot:7628670-Pyramimonas_sp.AAC.1